MLAFCSKCSPLCINTISQSGCILLVLFHTKLSFTPSDKQTDTHTHTVVAFIREMWRHPYLLHVKRLSSVVAFGSSVAKRQKLLEEKRLEGLVVVFFCLHQSIYVTGDKLCAVRWSWKALCFTGRHSSLGIFLNFTRIIRFFVTSVAYLTSIQICKLSFKPF